MYQPPLADGNTGDVEAHWRLNMRTSRGLLLCLRGLVRSSCGALLLSTLLHRSMAKRRAALAGKKATQLQTIGMDDLLDQQLYNMM